MQEGRNHFDILFEMINVLTNDKKADLWLLLQKLGLALSLDNVFIAERMDNGEFTITNTWHETNCSLNNEILLNKKYDDTCLCIEDEQSSKLIFFIKVRGMTPIIVVFVRNQSSYTWDEYEKGMLRSFCKLLKSFLMHFSMPNTDKLTGMPSLTDFMYEIERRHEELAGKYAVVYSDIQCFKNINNIYGI